MEISLQTEAPPLRRDGAGALRVSSSRVLLELVLRAFQDGATPEAIAQRYPAVTLADIYAVIAYYLRHREDMHTYLLNRQRAGDVRQKVDNNNLGDTENVCRSSHRA